MSHSPNDRRRQGTPPAPLPPSRNNHNNLSHSLQRLSISTAASTALPSSPQTSSSSPSRLGHRPSSTSSPSNKAPPRSPLPLRRSSSSLSLDARASTPTLLRKASMNSLHGVGGVTPSRSSPSRRSSSAHLVNASAMVGKPLTDIEDTEPPPPRHTAISIAQAHFKTELDLHENEEESRPTDTVAILHDNCYGHRYSRPRTSKASLSTIVERPERIHASILGLSVAYVRLGERHAEGRYPLHPSRNASSIPSAPFKIRRTTRKISLSSQAVTNVHGVKWMEELKIMCDNAEARLAMNGKELTRPDIARTPDQGVPAKLHEGDLFLCSESLNAMEGALGAVCEAVDTIFQGSASGKGPHRAFVAIRPPGHHCSASYPSGFCWVNNVHVGISHAALTHGLTHAAIIDFDLHHGDGSQTITWDHNQRANTLPKNALPWKKTSIGYFSLHDINSYPCEMGDEEKVKNASLCIENAHGQSIWNVHLLPWKSESEFWDLYESRYSILLEKTRNYLRNQTERLRQLPNGPKPKAAIFLSAGFDASEWESSGMQRHKVNVPTEFYARLTQDVVKLAAEEGTGVEGRVISVLEGGYSDRALCTGVFSHISGMVSGSPIITKEADHSGLGYEMGQKIGAFNGVDNLKIEPIDSGSQSYDPSWWSLPFLEQLDATLHPSPSPEPKKTRDSTVPTYSTPTQSFIAKVSSPTSLRNTFGLSNGSPRPIASRAPSPPPPEVDWATAAHELSKLLIPADRQTMSCKPEDLSAEATRARRDRQSILTVSPAVVEVPEAPTQRMALRTRKPAKAAVETGEVDDAKKIDSKASRRKTVAGTGALVADKPIPIAGISSHEPGYTRPTSQSSRRLSLASNTSDSSRPITHSRAPSISSVTAQRRLPSQNTRPDSSMSSRTESAPPIAVKKARAPAQPRAEPAKISRVRRKSPLKDANTVPTQEEHSVTQQPTDASSATRPVPAASQAADIDGLTSGMKKIKINLITKAQRDVKDQAKQTIKPIPAKTIPKTATSRLSKAKVAEKSTNGTVLQSAESRLASDAQIVPLQISEPQTQNKHTPVFVQDAAPLPQLPPHHTLSHFQQTTNVPLPANSPPVAPTFGIPSELQSSHQLPPRPSSKTPDVFIPYQPEGPTPQPLQSQTSIQWLPPNTGTPSPMKRGELPVFTSTSAIPFGVRPDVKDGLSANGTAHAPSVEQNLENQQEKEEKDFDIWEVPETPQKQ